MDWNELDQRIQYIRKVYADLKIPLIEGQGLKNALDEAENVVRQDKAELSPLLPEGIAPRIIGDSMSDCHVIWSLYDSIKPCIDSGLKIRPHLSNICTGSTNYGEASTQRGDNFYKDFEAELFVAASLIRKGIVPKLFDKPEDPLGDLLVNDVVISVKHHDSMNQLFKKISPFNKILSPTPFVGIAVFGVEDLFKMSYALLGYSENEYARWFHSRAMEIEQWGYEITKYLSRKDRILGTVQCSTVFARTQGGNKLERKGNSMRFLNKECTPEQERDIHSILSVFNPEYRTYDESSSGKLSVISHHASLSGK